MKSRQEKLAELKANPNDRRHGRTGYSYGCRCEKCKNEATAYFREYKKQLRMRMRGYKKPSKPVLDEEPVETKENPKRHLRTAKNSPDVCTLNQYEKALMLGYTAKAEYCLVCGRTNPLNDHHVVFQSAGKLVQNGKERQKPTITLCGIGNNLYDDHGRMYCHGAAHHRLLHFRYVPAGDGLGHWEYLFTNEPTKYETALAMDGWRRLGGKND